MAELAAKYADRLVLGPVPQHPARALITVAYTSAPAEKGGREELTKLIDENLSFLHPLLERQFLGAQKVRFSVGLSSPERLEVHAEGGLTPALLVIVLRLIIAMHDSDPVDFENLVTAIGSREEAMAIWGGVDWETEVAQITLQADGNGSTSPITPASLGTVPGEVLNAETLTVPGWSAYMPGPMLEDAILRLSGLKVFLPPGAKPENAPGEEEYFPSGPDLLISNLSIEASAFAAILRLLGPGPVPMWRID